MRTTVAIHNELLRQAKKLALERRCTLSALVEEGLQRTIAATAAKPVGEPTRLPTFRGRGVFPGVDLDSSAGLIDRMETR